MKKFLATILVASSLFAACGGSDQNTEGTDSTATADAKSEVKVEETSCSDAPYGIKSGVFVCVTKESMLNTTTTTTTRFDNYGKMEEQEMKCEGSVAYHKRSFFKDGFSYTVDLVENKAVKMSVPEEGMEMVTKPKLGYAIEKLSDDEKKAYQLEELGTETFLGKECKVYSALALMGKKSKTWVYKGILMKQEIEGDVVLEALSFEEDVELPAEFCDVPANLKVEELKIPAGAL